MGITNFESSPTSKFAVPNILNFSEKKSKAIDQEISNLLNKGAIEEAEHCPGE